jgi:hypothetical protein
MINWTPDSSDTIVSVALVHGSGSIAALLADRISNTGQYFWNLHTSYTHGFYTIAIAGGKRGTAPTDFTSSGEFYITGLFALSSSISSVSGTPSVGSSLASDIAAVASASASATGNSSAFGAGEGGASGVSSAVGPSTSTSLLGSSAFGASSESTLATTSVSTGSEGGAIAVGSTTSTGGGSEVSASGSSSGSSGGKSAGEVVRHADFAVIIFAFVCIIMMEFGL